MEVIDEIQREESGQTTTLVTPPQNSTIRNITAAAVPQNVDSGVGVASVIEQAVAAAVPAPMPVVYTQRAPVKVDNVPMSLVL